MEGGEVKRGKQGTKDIKLAGEGGVWAREEGVKITIELKRERATR